MDAYEGKQSKHINEKEPRERRKMGVEMADEMGGKKHKIGELALSNDKVLRTEHCGYSTFYPLGLNYIIVLLHIY